ncbi:FkbM family methyltransferase [Alsobacter sp. R-9]
MDFRVGEKTVALDEREDRVCARNGVFEPESIAVWAALAQRKGQMIDVGAYTGLYAIGAALHGCRVLAFEPHVGNARRLTENIAANGLRDAGLVDLIRGAASDRDGKAIFQFNPRIPHTSGGSLVEPPGKRVAYQNTEVCTYRIDSFEFDDLVAIKIDAERAEHLVLLGARQTIARFRPIIIVEVLDPDDLEAVKTALPGYRKHARLDGSNYLMVPVEC